MTNSLAKRDPQRGAVAILVAVLLMTLFGFAALAVDAGFLYTRSRTLQAAADAAVVAGMTDLQGGNMSTATTDATNMANAFGTANGYTLTVSTAGSDATHLQVALGMNEPLFFGSIFGFSSKHLTVTAIGKLTGTTAPAILALGGCGTGMGLSDSGNGPMTINGNVESNGNLSFSTGPSLPVMGTGFAESPCAGQPIITGGNINFAGGYGAGGPFPDPFATVAATLPACDFGTSLLVTQDVPPGNWGPGGTLLPGVYCSGGDLNASSPDPCNCMVATNVTFIAKGRITLGDNGPSSITANPAMPDGIVAYSQFAGGCGAGPAINIGFQDFSVGGSVYAPNGCINMGAQGVVTIDGSLIGADVAIGASSSKLLTIGSTSGGPSGSGWQMLQ